jgi:DNA-binding transcriptional LysR family regulator
MQSRNTLHLQLLVVVLAEQGSFIRAAKKLGIPQSSLTRKLSQLEEELGVGLFERTTRQLELTKAGRLFLPEAVAAMSHAERAWELARHQARIENGPLRIGYSPYIHSAFLPFLQRLHHAMDESPNIALKSALTLQMVEEVLQGKLHAGVGIGPIVDRDLLTHSIGQEGFCVCISKNHPLSRKMTVSISDLHGELLFWVPRALHPAFYSQVRKYIRGLGVQPIFKEVCARTQAIELVAQGFGMALMPRSTAHLSRSGIVFKPLADRYLKIETLLFTRRYQKPLVHQELIDDLVSRLQTLKTEIQ